MSTRTQPGYQKSAKRQTAKKNYKMEIILAVLSGSAVAGLALIFTIFPWLKPWNTDYEEMADAGHAESQMRLAQLAFDTGDYSAAISWYEMASENEEEYQAVACNNLGYLYATGRGLADKEGDKGYYNKRAYQLFRKALCCKAEYQGRSEAATNCAALLLTNGKEGFPNIDEKEIKEFLHFYHYSQAESVKIKKFPTYQGLRFQVGDIYYDYSGSEPCPETRLTTHGEVKTGQTKVVYTYSRIIYKTNKNIPEYQYIHLDFNDS